VQSRQSVLVTCQHQPSIADLKDNIIVSTNKITSYTLNFYSNQHSLQQSIATLHGIYIIELVKNTIIPTFHTQLILQNSFRDQYTIHSHIKNINPLASYDSTDLDIQTGLDVFVSTTCNNTFPLETNPGVIFPPYHPTSKHD